MKYLRPTECNQCGNKDTNNYPNHNTSHRIDYESQELIITTNGEAAYTDGWMTATCNNCGHKQTLQPCNHISKDFNGNCFTCGNKP